MDDFSTRVHREVIRFSQGAATPASVSGMSTAGSVVPGAVFSGLQAASQCAEVATGRVEELKRAISKVVAKAEKSPKLRLLGAVPKVE